MTLRCRFTPSASRDLEQILDYIAEQADVDTAEAILTKVNKKCQQLATFPSAGRKRDELSPNLRSAPVEAYLIFYRVLKIEIEIVRIVSGYRDLTALFIEN